MMIDRLVGGLLRLDDIREIVGWHVAFTAAWAARHPLRVLVPCGLCLVAAAWFYRRRQPTLPWATRLALTVLRGAALALVVAMLADPVLEIAVRHGGRPSLLLLFDGSESMAIEDALPDTERAGLAKATGLDAGDGPSTSAPRSRQDYVAAWVRKAGSPLRDLASRFRLRSYLLEAGGAVRSLDAGGTAEDGFDGDTIADQLTTTGEVTALGGGFEQLAQRQHPGSLQGVVVVSDFDQNAGPPAAEGARRLRVPVHAVGVGPATAVDLAVDVQAPLLMKKGERATVNVTLRQTGLDGATAAVRVTARPLDGAAADTAAMTIDTRQITLSRPSATIEIPFTPDRVGRHEITVAVEPLAGEVIADNNRATRESNVRDDFLRLLYVEDEPTWEWRFVKEVFHRDPLVGMRGFRTFLRSADPRVRTTNELFLDTPSPPRRDFFSTDVIFLGDMPGSSLGSRFHEMTREFVEKFGGGLVVIAGSRHGPGELVGTPLADMLPVVLEANEERRAARPFTPRLTADAGLVDFMRLGEDDGENTKAWATLGELPWYQPVARPHPQATVLATHPTDTCDDGRTLQPIIAIRRFGKGEVVYLGFNETWRLRRRYGERYYRQFWGQMIHRLGLSHAIGDQKRFVVRTDASRYGSDEAALVTVEAFDANFEPLGEEALPDRAILSRLYRPAASRGAGESETVALPQVRPGVFEARIPLTEAGEYRLRVGDPVTREESEVTFTVTALSAERQNATRNLALQQAIAAETEGVTCDLGTSGEVLGSLRPTTRGERSLKVVPLGMTWLCLGLGLALLVAEWAWRKAVNLV